MISTAITLRHPFAGANVVDHFILRSKLGMKQHMNLLMDTINNVINNLDINLENVVRVAVCGNPIQLSISIT